MKRSKKEKKTNKRIDKNLLKIPGLKKNSEHTDVHVRFKH